MKLKILVVEDEEIKRIILEDTLRKEGFEVCGVPDGLLGLEKIQNEDFDVLLADLRLPGLDGLSLLKETKRKKPNTSVIIMTAYGTIENAVEAMKQGAYDYITKPFIVDELVIKLRRLSEYRAKIAENIALKDALIKKYQFHNLIGKSLGMQLLFEKIKIVSESDVTVLIEGETGTGKELIAETIHYNSPRRNKQLVKLSCVMLPETLIESELFGYEKGAFSGAIRTKPGKLELADQGTLFLDDIDDIPVSIQAKLLRVLENKEIERLGSEKTRKIDIRIITATKQNLKTMVEKAKFRDDLFYRLNTIYLKVPPLRERKEDIPLLVKHFVHKYDKKHERVFSPEAISLLAKYDWPGNVRELQHFVEAVLVTTNEKTITPEHFTKDFLNQLTRRTHLGKVGLKKEIQEIQKEMIVQALINFDGNISRSARYLNIPRSTLRDLIKKLSITTRHNR